MKTDLLSQKQPKMALRVLLLAAFMAASVSARAATTFQAYHRFPLPASGSYVVTGAGLPDGRLLVWDGDNVYTQFSDGSDQFGRIAHGYQGDTAFVALSPDGHTALLGQGFAGDLYLFDTAHPADFTAGSVVTNVPSHFAGVYLNNHLVILDVGKADPFGSELDIIDLDTAKSGAKSLPHTVILKDARYLKGSKSSLVVDKPPFAYSASLAVDHNQDVLYAMDGNTRELRAFSTAALITAFNTSTPLDWATDGTLIGSTGQFFGGGAAGVRPNGNVVIGGSSGINLPGGIQIVDPSLSSPASATILDTLDPTGQQDYYNVIYNPYNDVVTGITLSGTAYAPQNSFVPVPVAGNIGLLVLAAVAGIVGFRHLRKQSQR